MPLWSVASNGDVVKMPAAVIRVVSIRFNQGGISRAENLKFAGTVTFAIDEPGIVFECPFFTRNRDDAVVNAAKYLKKLASQIEQASKEFLSAQAQVPPPRLHADD